MPDKYTKFLMHGNSDRDDFSLKNKTLVTTEQKVVGSHSVKLSSSDNGQLYWADSDDWTLGTNDWTWEGWFRIITVSRMGLFGQIADASNRCQMHYDVNGDLCFYAQMNSSTTYIAYYRYSWTPTSDTWYHIALVRSGGNMLLFIDGDLKTWTTTTKAISEATNFINLAAPFRIGAAHEGGLWRYLDSYVDGFRFSKGIARYTASFTPETERFDSDSYTKILFYADDIADVSDSQHSLESVNGNIGYGVGKFNNCPVFTGTEYLKTAPHSDWNIGSKDFTIELWTKFTSVNTNDLIGYRGTGNNDVWRFYIGGTGTIKFQSVYGGSTEINITTTYPGGLSTGTWYHMALVREGSEFRFYVDGIKIGSGTDSSALHYYENVGTLNIGMVDSGYYMNGYLDEVKLSIGIARYNQDFTAPTRPEDDFKIEGTLSEAGKLYLIDESTDVLERIGSFNAGPYDFVYLSSGRKFIAARKDADGEGKASGDIVPVTISGSEIFVDRFTGTNGSAPNSTYWTVDTSGASGSIVINSNKLRQTTLNSSGQTYTNYKTYLSGNFEIEVDYALVAYTSNDWWSVSLVAEHTSSGTYFRTDRAYNNTTGHMYRSVVNSSHDEDITSDTSGKLKICRFGSTMHMYYWNGSSWVSPRSNPEDASGQFKIYLRVSSGSSGGTITVDWDNFVRYAVL